MKIETHTAHFTAPLYLESGRILEPYDIVYETYGELNEAKDNVVLVCHALSGDAHVAGKHHPDDKKLGWWDAMVGPGKAIDTNKYFVICSNILGGCSGTTGPLSINPETNIPYGLDFPIITISDMVKVQKLLLDKIGVKKLLTVIGGSMGGMQTLQWAIEYPDLLQSVIAIATTANLNPQSIAFDAVGNVVGVPAIAVGCIIIKPMQLMVSRYLFAGIPGCAGVVFVFYPAGDPAVAVAVDEVEV